MLSFPLFNTISNNQSTNGLPRLGFAQLLDGFVPTSNERHRAQATLEANLDSTGFAVGERGAEGAIQTGSRLGTVEETYKQGGRTTA